MSSSQPALLIRASVCVAILFAMLSAQAQSSSGQNVLDNPALQKQLKSTPNFLPTLQSDKPLTGSELLAAAGLNKAPDAIDNEHGLNKLLAKLCSTISPAPLEKYRIKRSVIHSLRKEARAKDLENVTKRLREEIEFTKLSMIEDTGKNGEVIRRAPFTGTKQVLARYFELRNEIDNDPLAAKTEKSQIAAFESVSRNEKLRLLAQFDAIRANSGTRAMGGSYNDRVNRTLKARRPDIEARFKSIEAAALKPVDTTNLGCIAPSGSSEGLAPSTQPARQ
jgi:hypothetical protein